MMPADRESLVSVIIPVYNAARYLGEALASVMAQSYGAHEIIVVDDGSTDDSAQVARSFPVHYCRRPHGGPGAARNTGVRRARGGCLAFLDADDLWLPDKLERQMAAMASRPGIDAVFGRVEQFADPGAPAGPAAQLPAAGTRAGLHAGAMLIRRASFMRVGWFATHWHVGEFLDWYARAVDAGIGIVVLPEVVMRRRVHGNNLTLRSAPAGRADYARVLKAVLDRRKARPPE